MDNTLTRDEKILARFTDAYIAECIGRSGHARGVARALLNGGESFSVVAQKTGLSVEDVEVLFSNMLRGM